MKDIDYCEVCNVEEGVTVNGELWVCKKCNKRLKKESK
jgi:ribosomal protein L37AE/L43A